MKGHNIYNEIAQAQFSKPYSELNPEERRFVKSALHARAYGLTQDEYSQAVNKLLNRDGERDA